jgi:site-specific recombinase XerD
MITQKTIDQLVKEVLEELNSQGYSQCSIQKYSRSYQSLMEYTNSQGITHYSEGVGLNYLNNQYGFKLEGFFGSVPKPVSETLHHLLILWNYQQYSSVTWVTRGKKKAFTCPENYKDEYESFQKFCGLKKYTTLGLLAILNPVKNFLLYMESHHVQNLKDISQDNLSVFLSIYSGHSVRYRATIVSALRNFLKLLGEDGFIPPKTWQLLPNVRYSRNAFIPPSWRKEDVKKLLDAVDRGNPRGKRDYALLLLVVRLGLRASDIRNLKLHNIEWKNKKIVLIQKKTKQTLELPLLDDIGWALIDYLKNGRPKTKSDSVFINHKAPYGEFKDTNGMQHILWKYMSIAGIERPKNEHCGLHSLRSTLARTMLEVGTPLPTISEVLGHESIQTASIYLKINLEALRKCPIDPEEVFLHEQ